MADAENSPFEFRPSDSVCTNCGHPQSDHPMNDACWHEMLEGGQTKLCACPGYKATLNARTASEDGD